MEEERTKIREETAEETEEGHSKEEEDVAKSEDEKKKKGKKEKKKEKKKKVVQSLFDIPVITQDKLSELEPNIRIEGLKNVKLTALTQKILGCIVGEHVTAESPWVSINKELVDENLYLHHESSDFLPVRDDLANYTDSTLLMGYDPDYIPCKGEDVHRFYIAVTEKARENLLMQLEEERRSTEERLKNSVNKKILPWVSMGSEAEVDFSITKNTRPLIELQLETDIDELLRPVQFKDREVHDAKDGCVSIGPGRHEFPAVYKKRVDAAVQAIPVVSPHFAQTDPGIPLNAWTQYVYDMDTAQEAKERGSAPELLPHHKFSEADYLEKALEYNETFDLYTNDYPLLVRNEGDDSVPGKSLFEEYQAFTDVTHCKNMLISSIAWHPMWSGVVALAYSSAVRCLPAQEGDTNVDQVIRDVYARNPVLVWSFKDFLKPRLILESPREVCTISWCPTDPNVLVGGCASGQLIIWDLKGKLEAVEGREYLTPDQQRYRLAMETLVGWLKPQAPAQYVRPAALSNIQFSHAGRVTDIQWLSPYFEWNEFGHLIHIPVIEGRTSMQAITSAEDGVVMVWDLNKLSPDSGPGKPRKKKVRKRPSALTAQISPYKAGDRKFRPIYILYVNLIDSKVQHKLTTLSMKITPLKYELDVPLTEAEDTEPMSDEKESVEDERPSSEKQSEKKHDEQEEEMFSLGKELEAEDRNSIRFREIYRPVLNPTSEEPMKELKTSTDAGHVMTIGWEGFDFHKGEEITTEIAQLRNISFAVHDGPITCCVRSPFLEDVMLTVGGKVFALWAEELKGIPIFWRSMEVRVTCGSWSPYRPCVFHIGRSDGSLEVWDLIIRSDAPILVQSLSGQVLTTMNEHSLPVYGDRSILGVADYNNSFRLLFFPEEHIRPRNNELETLIFFVENEINIRNKYYAWNESFLKMNAEELKRIQELEEAREKERRDAELAAEQEAQLRAKLEEEETKRLGKTKNALESISDRYFKKLREEREKQMQRVLMEKKRLDKTELMAKQAPILMMKQMEKEKRKKQKEKVRQQQKIFDKTVAMLFPEVVEKPKEGPLRIVAFEEEIMAQQTELISGFEEMMASQLKIIKENPFNKRLKWEKLFSEGRERRIILDFPLYLRQKRLHRYYHRNEPRFGFTLGQTQHLGLSDDSSKMKHRVEFSYLPGSESQGEIEFEGEAEEEGDLFVEEDESGPLGDESKNNAEDA